MGFVRPAVRGFCKSESCNTSNKLTIFKLDVFLVDGTRYEELM